eukprot:TRINITY_DN100607_c0_g1_i1.p1 TRINITY_DN100607_c0_g1~~TRINITY_DN100607_c0_g1_i1.p1  ORF type:complete len:288 (-),score=67.18 TRINITY_DN100607_c0_g1_i1:109-972(-)
MAAGMQMPAKSIHPGCGRLPPLVEVMAPSGTGLLKLIKPPDCDALWAWYEERGREGADPSWADLWPTAAALAYLVQKCPGLVVGRSVLEMGCGLGVPGLAAAKAGASDVTLLDKEGEALHCAMSTAVVNGLTTAAVGAPSESGTVRAAVFDWSKPPELTAKPQVILASDVLYDKHQVAGLAASIKDLLGGTGIALISDPTVGRARSCRQAFVEAARSQGASSVAVFDVVAGPTASKGPDALGLEAAVVVKAVWGEAAAEHELSAEEAAVLALREPDVTGCDEESAEP